MPFYLGQIVKWRSQAHGYTKEKIGTVVAYVPPGERPSRHDFPDLYKGPGCGLGRSTESYVVRVGNKHYWPIASKLFTVKACAHCNGTGFNMGQTG